MTKLAERILGILKGIKLGQVGWEYNEDVLTFNGEPIGGTVHGRLEIDRWWPKLQVKMAEYIAKEIEEDEKP